MLLDKEEVPSSAVGKKKKNSKKESQMKAIGYKKL